jgi:RimJ/RimL family protein N-acetyltransferase
MIPVTLKTERLVLDVPVVSDVEAVFEYCQDAELQGFVPVPVPYELKHAEGFVLGLVPDWWANDIEYVWAIRLGFGEPLLGVVSWQVARGFIGDWLGAPHRDQGIMTDAVSRVVDWVLTVGGAPSLEWECVIGNDASAHVARKAGFTYTGVRPMVSAERHATVPDGWHAVLLATDNRDPKPSWPA